MPPSPRLFALLSPVLSPVLSLALLLSACKAPPDDFYSGYVEADYVRLASPIGGTLLQVFVRRGDQVGQGAPAFVLEQESERAAREEAQSRLQRAMAQLDNISKGKRPDEIAVTTAQLTQADAALALSQAELARQEKLLAAHFIAPARLDEVRAARERDQGRVRELQAQLRVARLGARQDELTSAREDIAQAKAQLDQAAWKLKQKTLRIPLAARVDDVLYRAGEWVPPSSPVVSLLAPEHIKARFFVPQARLGALQIGQTVTLSCDGCPQPVAATISFIAREAQYTAPLIYSKENRATLVFMVEARPAPAEAARLHPGQPLEIRLAK
jgi:HlyD family secretion protein